MSLDEYRAKRDFAASPEPSDEARADAGATPRFAVQEHHASSLHWDLRLERDGLLVSFALPRGIPPDPRQNRLAVRTEDHPLAYLTFEGEQHGFRKAETVIRCLEAELYFYGAVFGFTPADAIDPMVIDNLRP